MVTSENFRSAPLVKVSGTIYVIIFFLLFVLVGYSRICDPHKYLIILDHYKFSLTRICFAIYPANIYLCVSYTGTRMVSRIYSVTFTIRMIYVFATKASRTFVKHFTSSDLTFFCWIYYSEASIYSKLSCYPGLYTKSEDDYI